MKNQNIQRDFYNHLKSSYTQRHNKNLHVKIPINEKKFLKMPINIEYIKV